MPNPAIRQNADGSVSIIFSLVFTPPDDRSWGGVNIQRRDAAGNDVFLGDFYRSPAVVEMALPDGDFSWDFFYQSFDVNGRTNSIVVGVTPAVNYTRIGGAPQLDLSKAKTLTYDGSEFQVSTGAFRMKEINADKIKTGTLAVGGGTGHPGKMAVFDASGNAVGHIGVDGSDLTWLKTLGVGGSGYGTAKLKADASGNVSVIGTLLLALNDITATVDNTLDAGYFRGLRVFSNSSPSQRSLVGAGHVGVVASNGNGFASLHALSGYGYSEWADSSGAVKVSANGSSGQVTAENFQANAQVDSLLYKASGYSGVTATVTYKKPDDTTGTLVFRGGILTSQS